jgi:uncharacterized membrane protein YhdT
MLVKPVITREMYLEQLKRTPHAAEMAIYYIPIIMGTTMYAMMNFAFINLALTDISRRNI